MGFMAPIRGGIDGYHEVKVAKTATCCLLIEMQVPYCKDVFVFSDIVTGGAVRHVLLTVARVFQNNVQKTLIFDVFFDKGLQQIKQNI